MAVVALIVTLSAVESAVPSFTVKPSTYAPSSSAVNVGLTTVASERVALLPAGFDVKRQVYVNVSALASELNEPSSVTSVVVLMF